jgi:hypothetical protein
MDLFASFAANEGREIPPQSLALFGEAATASRTGVLDKREEVDLFEV